MPSLPASTAQDLAKAYAVFYKAFCLAADHYAEVERRWRDDEASDAEIDRAYAAYVQASDALDEASDALDEANA